MTWLSRNARNFGLARVLALILLVALAALRVVDPLPLQELRVRVFDLFQVLQPREATERPVVIVDIDEKSLRTVGQWPWPRTRVADLINRLTQMGALVIAFDIVFAEPDRMSPGVAADVFRDLDDATKSKLRALPSNDAVFAEALRNSHVVLGEFGAAIRRCAAPGRQTGGRHCDNGRRCTAFSAELPRPAPQYTDPRAVGQRARPVHHPRRARWHRAARADCDAGAGHDHAIADPRNVTRGEREQHRPDPIR